MPGVRSRCSATQRSTISIIAAGGVSGVTRMSRRAWAVRGMIVRRAVGEAPSLMKWLMFTVGRRNGFQTALSSHLANSSVASRRKASCVSPKARTRDSMSSMSRASGSTGFGTMLP